VGGQIQVYDLMKKARTRTSSINGWYKEATNDHVQWLQFIDASTVAIVSFIVHPVPPVFSY
jgi:hypothetical protein